LADAAVAAEDAEAAGDAGAAEDGADDAGAAEEGVEEVETVPPHAARTTAPVPVTMRRSKARRDTDIRSTPVREGSLVE
jgi:hypothetical protein